MAINITYFVHGTTADNENNISSGWKNAELSNLGRIQAKELGRQTQNLKFDIVFTSDLIRAAETAKLAWSDEYPIIRDSRLRECDYGDFNGKLSSIVEPLQEKSIDLPLSNGESYRMVENRLRDFLSFLKENYEGRNIAIVAHKAPQLALDVIIKKVDWKSAFEQDWRKTKSWKPGWHYTLK